MAFEVERGRVLLPSEMGMLVDYGRGTGHRQFAINVVRRLARGLQEDVMVDARVGAALAAILLSVVPATVAAQSPDDLAAARRLVGMWRLVERTVSFADGTSRPDPRTTAYIIYSDTGMTCYIAMDPARTPWKSEASPTPEEAVASIAGLGAYCGTFSVNAKEGSVVHTMEIERIPNLIGRARKRWYMFQDDDHLILKVDASEFRAPVVERRLLWERVPSKPDLSRR